MVYDRVKAKVSTDTKISAVGRKRLTREIRLSKTHVLLKKWLYFENFADDRLNGAEGKSELYRALENMERKYQNLYQLLESYYLINSSIGTGIYQTQLPNLSKVAEIHGMTDTECKKLLFRAVERLKTIMEKEGK